MKHYSKPEILFSMLIRKDILNLSGNPEWQDDPFGGTI